MFYTSTFDPWLILSQMAVMQAAFYIALAVVTFVLSVLFGIQAHLGLLFAGSTARVYVVRLLARYIGGVGVHIHVGVPFFSIFVLWLASRLRVHVFRTVPESDRIRRARDVHQ